MTIRQYQRDEHQGGFIGLMVVVKTGDKYRQIYFAYRGTKNKKELAKIRIAAEALNAEWNMERVLIQSKKELECNESRCVSSAYTTGVSSIKMKLASSKKKRDNGVLNYYLPYSKVSGSINAQRF